MVDNIQEVQIQPKIVNLVSESQKRAKLLSYKSIPVQNLVKGQPDF